MVPSTAAGDRAGEPLMNAAASAHVLVVDDLLATGGTLKSGCQLVEKAGGVVAGCAVLVEIEFLKGREKLLPYEVFSLIQV